MVCWMSAMREEWTICDVLQSLPVDDDRLSSNNSPLYSTAYPGNFNVLFMEYAKCFPSEVNKSGR
jgi:hypothetical protein